MSIEYIAAVRLVFASSGAGRRMLASPYLKMCKPNGVERLYYAFSWEAAVVRHLLL